MFAGDNLVSSIPVTSDWVVASGVWSSGTGVLRVGTETAIGAVGTRPIIVPRIGAYGNNNTNFVGPWDGDIAEIVFWMRALSSVELEEAHSALASKYGLAS